MFHKSLAHHHIKIDEDNEDLHRLHSVICVPIVHDASDRLLALLQVASVAPVPTRHEDQAVPRRRGVDDVFTLDDEQTLTDVAQMIARAVQRCVVEDDMHRHVQAQARAHEANHADSVEDANELRKQLEAQAEAIAGLQRQQARYEELVDIGRELGSEITMVSEGSGGAVVLERVGRCERGWWRGRTSACP